jgi:hypothetical protein
VTIEVTECPKDEADLRKKVTIYPVGLAEKLEVTLKLMCSCPCEDVNFRPVGDVMPPVSSIKCYLLVLGPTSFYSKTCNVRTPDGI